MGLSVKKATEIIDKDRKIKELEKLVELQQDKIERMRSAKFTLPTSNFRSRKGESEIEILIPDTHGEHINKAASKAFLNDLDLLPGVKRVVYMGDHLDCGGFLAQHHVIGTVPETEACFEEDERAANAFIDEVSKRCPNARTDYIEGNHEARIEKFIVKTTLGNPRNGAWMRKMFSPERVLNLDARGIRFVKRSQCYDGLKIPGTIDLDGMLARHGKNCGSTACQREVSRFGCNVAIAHTHRMLLASKETYKGVAYSYCFGCLCNLQPLYYDTDPTDWAHGYGIRIRKPGYGFIVIQVPIMDGRSYLEPLISVVQQ